MRRLLFALFLSILAVVPVRAAFDWTVVAAKLRDSVVNIETSEDGRCSGFVIDNVRDFVMTAAHCAGEEMYVDSEPAVVRAKDVKNDLMVLYVKGIDHDALSMATADPKIGEPVATYGFGWGLERPLFRTGHISDNKAMVPGIEGGPWVIVDAAFIPGQSGGPVVNLKGELVSIVLRTSDRDGFGAGVEVIRDKFGKYFTRQ